MITVIDYGRGNMFSVGQALRHLGAEFAVATDPEGIARATRLILPGVGAFGDAMAALDGRNLIGPTKAAAAHGVPILGICLGMQLLADAGEEFGNHRGLGLIPGIVRRLPDGAGRPDRCRIPNVGWRTVRATGTDARLAGAIDGRMMYFNHSYGFDAADPDTVTATVPINGADVAAVVTRDAVTGFQFHPEKSGAAGLALLRAFLDSSLDADSPPGKAMASAG